MTYFLNQQAQPTPGAPSGLTGGIRTASEGFWARWGIASMTGGFLNNEDNRAREQVVRDLAEQVRPRLTAPPDDNLLSRVLPGAQFASDQRVIRAARDEAAANPEAWADVDLSPEAMEADFQRRVTAQLEGLMMDAALAPPGSWFSDLAASMGAETLSQKTLPFLLVGGGSGSLLRVAATEAAINMGVTGALFADQRRAAQTLGLEAPSLTSELAQAAAFGAAFGAGFEALGRGLSYGSEVIARRQPGQTQMETEIEVERAVAALNDGPEAVAALNDAPAVQIEPDRPALLPSFLRPGAQAMPTGPVATRPAAANPVAEVIARETQRNGPSAEVIAAREADLEQMIADFERDFPAARAARPFTQMIRRMGGIRTTVVGEGGVARPSFAAQELASRGIDRRSLPGLFNNRTGSADLDNLQFDPDLMDVLGRSDDGLYANREAILDFIAREAAGERVPMSREMEARMRDIASTRGAIMDPEPTALDLIEKPEPAPDGLFFDDASLGFLTYDDMARQIDQYLARSGYGAILRPEERSEPVDAMTSRGGEAEDMIIRLLERELDFEDSRHGDTGRRAETPEQARQRELAESIPFGDADGGSGTAGQDGRAAGATERTAAGEQFVAPGITPVTERARLEARQNARLGGGPQGPDSIIGGMFDAEAHRRDLFDNLLSPQTERMQAAVAQDMRDQIAATPGANDVVATFTTAKGSIYQVFGDGTTLRNKMARSDAGHEGDSGTKPRTAKTIYVNADAAELSAAGIQGASGTKFRVVINGDRAALVWPNEKSGQWGKSMEWKQYSNEPAVGRFPVELWNPSEDVSIGGRQFEAYRGMHAGNAIVGMEAMPPTMGDFPVMMDDGTMRPASAVLDEMDLEDGYVARIDLCGMMP